MLSFQRYAENVFLLSQCESGRVQMPLDFLNQSSAALLFSTHNSPHRQGKRIELLQNIPEIS